MCRIFEPWLDNWELATTKRKRHESQGSALWASSAACAFACSRKVRRSCNHPMLMGFSISDWYDHMIILIWIWWFRVFQCFNMFLMPCSAVCDVQQPLLCENSKTDGREVVDGEAHILWMVLWADRLTAGVSRKAVLQTLGKSPTKKGFSSSSRKRSTSFLTPHLRALSCVVQGFQSSFFVFKIYNARRSEHCTNHCVSMAK